jgi:hypothetical protein
VQVAAVVNEVAPNSGSAKQLTTYNTVDYGTGRVALAKVESQGPGTDPWSTGLLIMNTSSNAGDVTLTYYNASSGVQIGSTVDLGTLQPNRVISVYQPKTYAPLPAGTVATAVIAAAGGTTIAVNCNEADTTPITFMSYSGQWYTPVYDRAFN